MAKQIIIFEGIVDYDSGWEFGMPIIMIKPAFRFCIGNNSGYIDNMIEDYIIDVSLNYCENYPEREYVKKNYQREFEKAKRGRSRMSYWKRVVEWNPDNLEEFQEMECINPEWR